MDKGYLRKDKLSEIKLQSGGLVLISLEQIQNLFENLTGKHYDIFELFQMLRSFDGDIINMDMMETIIVEGLYTLNTDGTNCKHVTISHVKARKQWKNTIFLKQKDLRLIFQRILIL